jgi:hypothetical protein
MHGPTWCLSTSPPHHRAWFEAEASVSHPVVVDLNDLSAEVISNEGRSHLTYGLGDVAEDQPGDDALDPGVMDRPPGLGHMR